MEGTKEEVTYDTEDMWMGSHHGENILRTLSA